MGERCTDEDYAVMDRDKDSLDAFQLNWKDLDWTWRALDHGAKKLILEKELWTPDDAIEACKLAS